MLVMVEVDMPEEQEDLPFVLRSHEEVDTSSETSKIGTVRLTDLDYWYVYWLHQINKGTPAERSHAQILGPIIRAPLAAQYSANRQRIEELRAHRIKEERLKKSRGVVSKPLKGRRKGE